MLAGDRVPRLYGLEMDGYGFFVLAGIALITAVLFGSLPLFISSSSNLQALLQREGRSATGDRRANRLRSACMVAEVAISVVLLTGAGFLLESFSKVLDVNPGFDAHHLLTMSVSLNPKAFKSPNQNLAAVKRLLDDLRRIPGVQSASAVNGLPLSGEHEIHGVQALGKSKAAFQTAEYRVVDADYFHTMRIRLIRGRTFRGDDGTALSVINEDLAARLWPGEDPIGKKFREDDKGPYTVIGVVGNVHSGSLEQRQTMQFYRNLTAKNSGYASTFVMRTSVDPSSIALQAQKAVWRADAGDAVTHTRPMEDIVQAATLPRKFGTGLFTGFAISALLLAALGLFSVVSLSVTRRTREFGNRLALGATGGDIMWLELSRALVLLFAGMAVGVGLSVLLANAIRPLLFHVTTANPEIYAASLLILLAATLLAAWLPTRRAAKIDPASALHE